MPPSGFIDKLIHLVTNSGPIGFALFFMSMVVFGLRYFKSDAVAFIDTSAMGYSHRRHLAYELVHRRNFSCFAVSLRGEASKFGNDFAAADNRCSLSRCFVTTSRSKPSTWDGVRCISACSKVVTTSSTWHRARPPDAARNWDRVFASSGTDGVYETSWRVHSEDVAASSTWLFFDRDELRLTRSLP
jgi:hypothetical protein